MRDLGLMGESHFSSLCGEAGLVPNGSKIDKTGWDFLVEFPFKNQCLTSTIHDSAYECKIQVKATDKLDKKIPITLSNLRRLATTSIPAFFVFIEFESKSLPQRIYLVHVCDELITKIIKRLYEIKNNGEIHKANKMTMSIKYGEEHLLKENNGEALKDTILSHIGSNYSQYISHKMHHLSSTGYENGALKGTFDINGEDELNRFVDVSLGISDSIRIENIKSFESRFDIMSKTPTFDAKEGMLSMPDVKPTSRGKVVFKNNKIGSGVEFDAYLFTSPFNYFLPAKFLKIRVSGDFFEFIIHNKKSRFKYSISHERRINLITLRDALKFISSVEKSGTTKYLDLLFKEFRTPSLEIVIYGNDKAKELTEHLNILNCAHRIVSKFDFTGLISISINDIESQKEMIQEFDMIINAKAELFKVRFDVTQEYLDLSVETICIFPIMTQIGSRMFVAIMTLQGVASEVSSDKYEVIAKKVEICDTLVSEYGGALSKDDIYEEIKKICENYNGKLNIVTCMT